MSYPEDFLHICQDDFSGILRGKTLCHPTEKPIQDCKTGWIPSNALITFFGALTPLPEVEVGDLQFVPALEKQTLRRREVNRVLEDDQSFSLKSSQNEE